MCGIPYPNSLYTEKKELINKLSSFPKLCAKHDNKDILQRYYK